MRFIFGLAAGIAAVAAAWCLLVWMQAGRPTLMSQWIADAYAKKLAAAARTPSPKMVIVAGSNALFGIDSAMLERHFGLPVVNLGVNAGILLPAILAVSKPALRPGDIVLLPLEYPMYTYDGVPNAQMIDYLFSRRPGLFWDLSLKEEALTVWGMTFARLMRGFFARGGTPVDYGLYGAHRIDRHGDQILTETSRMGPEERQALSALKAQHYGRDKNENALAWTYLDAFRAWAQKQRITLIFLPPAFLGNPLYSNDPVERDFYTGLAAMLAAHGLTFVGDPYASMYPLSSFFNTDYHLNAEAREENTRRIIKDLDAYFSLDRKNDTPYNAPKKPHQ
jgi:hypothetical protein